MEPAGVGARGKSAGIGIMGGTFDPIHYGHLVTAEGARSDFGLDTVVFVPAARPPHKEPRRILAAEHRLTMTTLAVDTNPYFSVSAMEVERRGPSYTIDTVREMQLCYPGREIYFITGADAVLEILTWKNVGELMEMCYFIAATRPGYQLENLQVKLASLPPGRLARIHSLVVPALAISSTDIRQRVREGRPIKYLLPEVVEDHIHREGLYRT
ncbi:MAG: nicotinate-nucleotide adenylyltransferase [Peptococcaceae bacterium]|jgi:nicotinate-nucleotide adenylyltransferase|nr:nicotinate-nucleotide adenylyltransferase [Peptococcaceae bacterium]